MISPTLIHWIVIYPVDSAIPLLNNWGQKHCQNQGNASLAPRRPLLPRRPREVRERASLWMTSPLTVQNGLGLGLGRVTLLHSFNRHLAGALAVSSAKCRLFSSTSYPEERPWVRGCVFSGCGHRGFSFLASNKIRTYRLHNDSIIRT